MVVTRPVGREQELEGLRRALGLAAGGQPQVVLVSGEPGAGKTTLLQAFVHALGAPALGGGPDPVVLRWTGDERERDLTLGMVHNLLDVDDTAADPWRAGAQVLSRLGELAGGEDGPAAPVVLVLDDLHLADVGSATALNFAVRRLRQDAVLVVASVRDDRVADLPASIVRLAEETGGLVRLTGLSASAVQELASAVGLRALPRRAAIRLVATTRGNPLHVLSVLREVPAEVLEHPDDPLPAPQSFADLVRDRVAELPARAQEVLRAAAVLGESCRVADVAAVCGLAGLEVWEALQDPVEHRLVLLAPDRASLRFDHPLVRSAVLGDLGPAARATLHLRSALVVPSDEALHHRSAAAVGPDERLARDLEVAGAAHRRRGELLAAAGALRAAHRLSPPGPEAAARLLAAVEALVDAGDVASASAVSDEIAALPRTARRLAVQARLAWLGGNADRGRRLGRAAWRSAASGVTDLDPAARDRLAAMLAQVDTLDDHCDEARLWAERALAEGRLAGPAASHTRAQRAMAIATSGRLDVALDSLGDLSTTPERVHPERHAELAMRGLLLLLDGRPGPALADLRTASDPRHGDLQPFRLVARSAMAQTLTHLGRWDEAQAVHEQLVDLAEDMDQRWLLGYLHAVACPVPAWRGELDLVRQHLSAAAVYAGPGGSRATEAYVDDVRVLLAACRSDHVGTLAAAARLRTTPHTSPQRDLAMLAWPLRVLEALVETGDLDQADRLLEEVAARHRGRGPRCEVPLLRLRGQVAAARRDVAGAREHLAAAAETATSGDAVDAVEQAHAVAALGRFLRRRGERRSGVRRLREARERYEALRAQPLVARCDTELAAAGVTTTPDPVQEDPLTPQERVVATLVCQGRTNRQVADELLLSVKTVGHHLTNVYAKLDVHSRTQLVGALGVTRSPRPPSF